MLLPIIVMIVGLSWVSGSLFFRREIDPVYHQFPLLSSMVILFLVALHATVLLTIGRSLGRPYLPTKKRGDPKGIPPPSHFFVTIWSIPSLLLIGAGFLFGASDWPLSIAFWAIGGIILLSSLCFLLIPTQVHSENAQGDIVFTPNPVRMAPKAVYFWSSSNVYGSFFLIAGAMLKATAAFSAMISIGTGIGWLAGAMILSIVALLRMGIGGDDHGVSKTKMLVPEENYTQISGGGEIKNELAQILSQVASAQQSMGSVPNGILLTGESPVSHLVYARALSGEFRRPFYPFSLKSLLGVDPKALDNSWKGFLVKIKPFNPLVIYIEDYGSTISMVTNSNPQGLNNLNFFLSHLSKNRTHLLIASAEKADNLPKPFVTPPIIHWILPVPLPDMEMRQSILGKFLLEETKKQELLPGDIPLLTPEMVREFDLGKLAALMEGFKPEDIRDVVTHSSDYAKKLRRSLRQLDVDVAIRRKAQNWKDPTSTPMEIVRGRLTDQVIGTILVNRAETLFSNRQKKSYESVLILGRNRPIRRMIVEKVAKLSNLPLQRFPDEKNIDGSSFRNFLMRSRKVRPSMVFIDPLEELFPKVQLSNFGFHGEIYNQKVMELSQINEDKGIWVIAGADDVNKIDPFIVRRFNAILDLSERGRTLFSEIEEFALGKILEGVPPEEINFEEFDSVKEKQAIEEAVIEVEEPKTVTLSIPPPPLELIPGFPGRPELQDKIRTIVDAGSYNIKIGGSGIFGSFMFLGSRGTGKREAAEAIALLLNPPGKSLVFRDMGLYSERLFARILLQRPLGFSKSSPLPEGLITVLEDNPNAVIYLDNIEQAHSSAWDFLHTYLKEGVIDFGGKHLSVPKSTLILGTSLFSGDDIELFGGGSVADMMIEKLSEKNRRLAYLPVFGREILHLLDGIIPFPQYTDSDILDMAQRTLYSVLQRFAASHPMKGVIGMDPDVPAFITLQMDLSTVTVPELNRKIQSMILPVLKQIEAKAPESTTGTSLRIGIAQNRLVLTEGTPALDSVQSGVKSEEL